MNLFDLRAKTFGDGDAILVENQWKINPTLPLTPCKEKTPSIVYRSTENRLYWPTGRVS